VLGVDRGYEDSAVFKAKREVEKYLQNSGLNYTILRPAGFASSLLPLAERFRETGLYLLIGDGKNRTSVVSTDDLAHIAADSPTVEGARNQILSVGGPDVLTRDDIARIFGRLFKREPIVINPPMVVFDGLRNAVGLLNPQAQKGLGTLRVLLANEFFCTPEEVQHLESIYGMRMESLESFLRRNLSV
ncbi:MAG: NAD(P)H-binding protein, partial [Microcoleus sp. PH2017_03_ELD_O_A]|nr:NAD(P)H-binding protein [Microcoleus sp. PH2017_03_ELD_O_A]